MKKNKKQSTFKSLWNTLADFFIKYHLIIITLLTSIICSFGVAFYSAKYSEDIFPSPAIGFILILIIELGLDTIRYIAVAANAKGLLMFCVNLLFILLFITSAIPATIGIGKNNIKDEIKQQPELSSMVAILEESNKSISERMKSNNKLMLVTDKPKIFNTAKSENSKYQKDYDSNINEIKNYKKDFEDKKEKYKKFLESQSVKDSFYQFMNDYLLKSIIFVIQFLNVTMSILGSMHLAKMKVPTENIHADNKTNQRLNIVEEQVIKIGAYTNSIKEQMLELAGELDKSEEWGKKPLFSFNIPAVESEEVKP